MDQPRRHLDTELIQINKITERIIGCAIEVHRVLRCGLFEAFTVRHSQSSSTRGTDVRTGSVRVARPATGSPSISEHSTPRGRSCPGKARRRCGSV